MNKKFLLLTFIVPILIALLGGSLLYLLKPILNTLHLVLLIIIYFLLLSNIFCMIRKKNKKEKKVKKTISISPHRYWEDNTWKILVRGKQEEMIIHVSLDITNLTNSFVTITEAIMKRPKIRGAIDVRSNYNGEYGSFPLKPRDRYKIKCKFIKIPPFKDEGETFFIDVIILDHLGNRHKEKKIEIKYLEKKLVNI